jgi:hypothetical protein
MKMGSPSPFLKYTRRVSSGDQDGAESPCPRNARALPPVNGMSHFGALESPACVNQISPPSPEKPMVLRMPGALKGGRSRVRLRKCPVPT